MLVAVCLAAGGPLAPVPAEAAAETPTDRLRADLERAIDRMLPGPEGDPPRAKLAGADSPAALAGMVRPWVVLRVDVNPESRVKLTAVTALPDLVVDRPGRFLVEVHNDAGIRAPLRVVASDRSAGPSRPAPFCVVSLGDGVSAAALSGEALEWIPLEVRCTAPGRWEVHLEADVGQGTQDLGFRAATDLLFRGLPAAGPTPVP
ncbi:MAG: hypothetical protein EBR86_09865 [Planctomycetia bacterium]|nr:hypothetical protein [Planctomycetia bacterium]